MTTTLKKSAEDSSNASLSGLQTKKSKKNTATANKKYQDITHKGHHEDEAELDYCFIVSSN